MCWPLTSQALCAAGSFGPGDEEDAVLGLLGGVVNRPLPVSVPGCRDKDTRRILELISFAQKRGRWLSQHQRFWRWPRSHAPPAGFLLWRSSRWIGWRTDVWTDVAFTSQLSAIQRRRGKEGSHQLLTLSTAERQPARLNQEDLRRS